MICGLIRKLAKLCLSVCNFTSSRPAFSMAVNHDLWIEVNGFPVSGFWNTYGPVSSRAFKIHAAQIDTGTIRGLPFFVKGNLRLMDIRVPFMDGVETTRINRQSTDLGIKKDITVIALTVRIMQGERKKPESRHE